MKKIEWKLLKTRIRKALKREIRENKEKDEKLKWERWDETPAPEEAVSIIGGLRELFGHHFAIFRRGVRKVLFIALVAVPILHSFHPHEPQPDYTNQFIQEYSQIDLWSQRATQNPPYQFANYYIKLPYTPTHIDDKPEPEIPGTPATFVYAQISGFAGDLRQHIHPTGW